MKILIVSYYFAPQNLIGAVRPTKLAKYLTRMGHDVTVVCGAGRDGKIDPTLERDMQELTDVHLLTEWNPLRTWYMRRQTGNAQPVQTNAADAHSSPSRPSALKGCLFRIVDTVYVYLRWLSDCSFRRMGERELKKLQGPYDAVFSSYAPFSVHEIAHRARQMGLAKKWIADFRDEVGMPFRYQEGKKQRYMQMLRRDADVLCAVSDGFLDMMHLADIGRVLSNGFDREDLPQTVDAPSKDCLRVVYCGQMQDSRREVGDRNITPMFRALARLVREGLLSQQELRLVYAGREGALFTRYAQSCGLEACVEDHGQVSREASIALQKGANVLLMASHHMASQRGILTGKLFEYMMMDKPIVCCMAGDLPDSGVKRVLRETGMGFCCEAANGAADENGLYEWMKHLLQLWRESANLLTGKNVQSVEQYEYAHLADVLAGWMAEDTQKGTKEQ